METQQQAAKPTVEPVLSANIGDIEGTLLQWWRELLGVEEITLDDDFFDLGGHSLIGLQLFSNIKERFGVDLGLATLFEARTIRQISDLIRDTKSFAAPENQGSKTVIPVQPYGTETPLFWVPGGFGTSVLAVRELAELLGSNQPFYGFETAKPGPEEEIEAVPARAERFIKELKKVQPNGPYRLAGFCGGGYVAWEMALQLLSAGEQVSFLGLVECYDLRHPSSSLGKLQYRVQRLMWRSWRLLKHGPKAIAEKLASVAQRAGLVAHRGEMPTEPGDPLEQVKLSLFGYHPAMFPGKTYLFLARDSYDYAGLGHNVDPRVVWRNRSKSGSEISVIAGDHEEILKAPNVECFASLLGRCMKTASEAHR